MNHIVILLLPPKRLKSHKAIANLSIQYAICNGYEHYYRQGKDILQLNATDDFNSAYLRSYLTLIVSGL